MRKLNAVFRSLTLAILLAFSPLTALADTTDCAEFNGKSADEKLEIILASHAESIGNYSGTSGFDTLRGPGTDDVLQRYLGSTRRRIKEAGGALAATTQFLAPDIIKFVDIVQGASALPPTFLRDCDFFEDSGKAKRVHALGSLALARFNVWEGLARYDGDPKTAWENLVRFDEDGKIQEKEIPNPWTGILSPRAGGVGLFVRFSIANPVGEQITVGNKNLSLEFIPGIGLKFPISGKKSVDLVAMESLAGQGIDHNFFRYEFSNDFSANAPGGFNTSGSVLPRYGDNPVNHHVMKLVGKRFAQAIPMAFPEITGESLDPQSAQGPHPFVMSIQRLAKLNPDGTEVSSPKRPWRLVFLPHPEMFSKRASSSTPYEHKQVTTDFRYKLADLGAGSAIYLVLGETRAGKRFVIGDITLESKPLPSRFADRAFFVQHELDNRGPDGFAASIVAP